MPGALGSLVLRKRTAAESRFGPKATAAKPVKKTVKRKSPNCGHQSRQEEGPPQIAIVIFTANSRILTSALRLSHMNLRIGIPSKGRLAELAAELLVEAGLKFRRQERSLFARVRDMPIDVTFLRTDDIPCSVPKGRSTWASPAATWSRNRARNSARLALGLGNCRLAFCVPEDSDIRKARGLAKARIATSFPSVTERYLEHHKVAVTSSSSPARLK